MKILYVLPPNSTNPQSGIRQQALIWKDSLIHRGHEVIEFSPWSKVKWDEIDIIHIFGFGLWLIEVVQQQSLLKKPIVLSPIIDTYKPVWLYKLASFWGWNKLRIYSLNSVLRIVKNNIDKFLVRSNHEYKYIAHSYGVENNRIALLRLPNRIKENDIPTSLEKKQNFCLHVSAYTQKRKNVMNLMKAAIKYNFNLKIAGHGGGEVKEKVFKDFAANYPNIEILGSVSEEQLLKLYREAKVFALPSFDEGVGFVALEAASQGCNVVITNIGGPKEYYDGMAYIVNPYDIDSIGEAVIKAMESPFNPNLQHHIVENYNLRKNAEDLEKIYLEVIEKRN